MLKKRIVILGGGTAGWMTAAALAATLRSREFTIELISSDEIGTVGVGEATLPHLRQFNQMLGVDENEFMRVTGATYKLGIQFSGWGGESRSYIHPFGRCGSNLSGIDFHHYWLKLREAGLALEFDQYSIAVHMAQNEKFIYPSSDFESLESDFGYAFHIDATLYGEFLKQYSFKRGVTHIEGKVYKVETCNLDGQIKSLLLDSGGVVEGDLFIDCSGGRALLIDGALGTPFESWENWLPCNKAWVAPSVEPCEKLPYTKSTAKKVGWQWKIPLQHRVGNGYVFCDKYIADAEALDVFLAGMDSEPVDSPRLLSFRTGKRSTCWNKNVVAVGLSSGFLEPLESTSIYLIQVAIQKLLNYFPIESDYSIERDAFNRDMNLEYDRIRDFLVLHYHATDRNDSDFWNYCREMDVPDSLKYKMDVFRDSARVVTYRNGLFMPASWLAVYLGQGREPIGFDRRVQMFELEHVQRYFSKYVEAIEASVLAMPLHESALTSISKSNVKYSPASLSLYGAKS